jgi:hypothetical protein
MTSRRPQPSDTPVSLASGTPRRNRTADPILTWNQLREAIERRARLRTRDRGRKGQQTGSNHPSEGPKQARKNRDEPWVCSGVYLGFHLRVSHDPPRAFTPSNYIGVIPEHISHGRSQGFKSPHLHHSRRSLTCGFPYLDDHGGTLGPHRGRPSRRAGPLPDLLEALGERVELVWVQVAVLVQSLHRVLRPSILWNGLADSC